MRKVEKLAVEYVGYASPETTDELLMEILGLETAIAQIKSRIAVLRQSEQLVKMGLKNENVQKNITETEEVDKQEE